MSKILYVMLGFVITLSLVFTGINQSVKAEVIQPKDLESTNLQQAKLSVDLISKEKFNSYGVSDKTSSLLNVKIATNYAKAIKKGNLQNIKTTKTITTSKNKQYVSVQYKLEDSKKNHTWITYTVDTQKDTIIYSPTMLKNEVATTNDIKQKITKKFGLSSEQLKSKSALDVKPVQFYFNNKGELEYLYDSYYKAEKKSKVLKVSQSKPQLNKSTYKITVKSSLLK